MKKYLVILLLIPIKFISQNLVLNPSFEDVEQCKGQISRFGHDVIKWSIPNAGTTDIFSICKEGMVGIPENYNGNQFVQFGENYAGCYFYSEDDYREYVQGTFRNALEAGKKYKVSFYISLGDKSKYALKQMGLSLTQNRIGTHLWTEISRESIENLVTVNDSFHTIESDNYFDDQQNWMYVSKEIIARGGEKYITIGNFQKNSKTKKTKVAQQKRHNISYYYIDMISVTSMDFKRNNVVVPKMTTEIEIVEIAQSIAYEYNKIYVLENIHFLFDSVELSTIAIEELKRIYRYLESHGNTRIEVYGHTDNKGSIEYNAELSKNRASTVAEYFVQMGLSKSRIQSFGFGNTKPLFSNETESGRKGNRRVEFRISKNKN